VSWCPLGYNNLPLIRSTSSITVPHYRYAGYQYYPAWTVVSRSHFGHGWVHDGAVNWGWQRHGADRSRQPRRCRLTRTSRAARLGAGALGGDAKPAA
jgi:hypothetical protein